MNGNTSKKHTDPAENTTNFFEKMIETAGGLKNNLISEIKGEEAIIENYVKADEDLLDTSEYRKVLTKIIETHNKTNASDSLMIAVDSSWGTGKSTFIHMWKEDVEKRNPEYEIVIYDAWANDYWENAFEPLMERLMSSIALNSALEKKGESAIVDVLKGAGKIAVHLAGGFIKNKTGIDINDEVVRSGLANLSDSGKKIYDLAMLNLESFKEFKEFKENINLLNRALCLALNNEDGKVIVIVIDELDRCKPTFAIQTLEIVKHILNNVSNIVFVFSIDLDQLSHSIAAVYGRRMDSVGYLRRFFNYIFKFPEPKTQKYIDHLVDKKYHLPFDEKMKADISALFKSYGLSIRDINIIFNNFSMLCDTVIREYDDDVKFLYLDGLIVKYKKPEAYKLIKENCRNLNMSHEESESKQKEYLYLISKAASKTSYPFVKLLQTDNTKMIQYNRVAIENGFCVLKENHIFSADGTLKSSLNELTVSELILQTMEMFVLSETSAEQDEDIAE